MLHQVLEEIEAYLVHLQYFHPDRNGVYGIMGVLQISYVPSRAKMLSVVVERQKY